MRKRKRVQKNQRRAASDIIVRNLRSGAKYEFCIHAKNASARPNKNDFKPLCVGRKVIFICFCDSSTKARFPPPLKCDWSRARPKSDRSRHRFSQRAFAHQYRFSRQQLSPCAAPSTALPFCGRNIPVFAARQLQIGHDEKTLRGRVFRCRRSDVAHPRKVFARLAFDDIARFGID